jgi:hypothetical protein
MSGIVKGIKKVAKGIFKGVKKVFKKITSSTIGKVLIAAAVIYTGGVLFGQWGATGPLSSIHGAWGGAGAAGAPGLGVGTPSAIPAAAPITTVAGGAGLPSLGATTVAGGAALPPLGAATQAGGVLSGISQWAQANPLLVTAGLQGISSALSPDEEDMLRLREEARKERYSSLIGAGDIDLGVRPSSTEPLKDISGVPWHERLRRGGV